MAKEKTEQAVLLLARAFAPPMPEASTLRLYVEELDDLPSDLLELAVRGLIRGTTSKFLPRVGEVREQVRKIAVERGDAEKIVEPERAWNYVEKIAKKYGTAHKFPRRYPTVASCVDAIGWERICHTHKLEIVRQQFLKLYAELSGQAQQRQLFELGESIEYRRALLEDRRDPG